MVKKILAKDMNKTIIPIIGFWGPPDETDFEGKHYPSLKTNKVFRQIKKAGFNCFLQGNDDFEIKRDSVERTLGLCKQNNLLYYVSNKSLLNIKAFHNDTNIESNVSIEDIKFHIKDYIHHENCAGIFAVDEPLKESFESLGKFITSYKKALKELNEDKGYYVNLLPKCGFTGVKPGEYEDYLSSAIDIGKIDYLSFDFYPFRSSKLELKDNMSPGIYNLLGVVRETALKKGVPYGACVQMGGNWTEETDNIGVRRPKPEEVRWEVNLFLAYGCTVITYFTLCNPHSFFKYLKNHGETGVFLPDGRKSEYYNIVKEVNNNAQNLSKYFLNGVSKKIILTGDIPSFIEDKFEDVVSDGGYKKLAKIEGNGVITGCFDYENSNFYYVVNHFNKKQKITLNFEGEVELSIIDSRKEKSIKGKRISFTLDKGGAKLVVVK